MADDDWRCQRKDCSAPKGIKDPVGHIFQHLKIPLVRCPYCPVVDYSDTKKIEKHVKDKHPDKEVDVIDKRPDNKEPFDREFDSCFPDYETVEIRRYRKPGAKPLKKKAPKPMPSEPEPPPLTEAEKKWMTPHQIAQAEQKHKMRMKEEADRELLHSKVCIKCHTKGSAAKKEEDLVRHVFECHIKRAVIRCFHCDNPEGLSYFCTDGVISHVETAHPNKQLRVIDRRRAPIITNEFDKAFKECFPQRPKPPAIPTFRIDWAKEAERAKVRVKEEYIPSLYDDYYLGKDSDVEEIPIEQKKVETIDLDKVENKKRKAPASPPKRKVTKRKALSNRKQNESSSDWDESSSSDDDFQPIQNGRKTRGRR